MAEYSCKQCGAPAEVSPAGTITRSCRCDCGIVAGMSAVAYGEGHASAGPSKLQSFVRWLNALLSTRPAR